jgi:tetratricopeptide (TPR) repeat protein
MVVVYITGMWKVSQQTDKVTEMKKAMKMKAKKAIRALTLSILLLTGFVINVGCVASGQADNEFEINTIVETVEDWGVKGISFGELGEYEEAIECFNRAIELNPNDADAYNCRGFVYYYYYYLGQHERAIKDFSKAIKLDPNNADAYFFRGSVYGQLKQYEKAIEDFNRAIELNPTDIGAYYYRVLAMSESKKQKLTPGFETIFAITGFLAVAYRLRRMR